MNFTLQDKLNIVDDEYLVIGYLDNDKQSILNKLDNKYHKIINRLFEKTPEQGDFILQADFENHSICVLNFGTKDTYTQTTLKKYLKKIIKKLITLRIKKATLYLPQLNHQDANWQLKQMILTIEDENYQFLNFKSKKQSNTLDDIAFYLPNADKKIINEAQCICAGINLTKNLTNLPANICTPSYLAQEAIELAASSDLLNAKIIHRDEMLKLGMGGLLAVAKGSEQPPQLIELAYKGMKDAPTIVFVGKGVTFDSGGISIKPADFMNEMKYDMAGAASVFGVIKAAALLKLPINIVGIIASAENMPGGSALKPGDIIHTMQGLTVEVTNTDAEGRLILADALAYSKRFNPKFVIDIATLTGAMIISLGRVMSGFMSNDDELAKMLVKSSKESGEKIWQLPLDEEYAPSLESPIADLTNCPMDRAAGSIAAAAFLECFAKEFRWAHLDIAGTAWVSGKNREATGRPVALLIQFAQDLAKEC